MEPGWWLSSFIFWFGGSYWDGEITITSKENFSTMDWFLNYHKRFGSDDIIHFQSGSGDFASPNNPFFTEKVAMVLQGP